MNVLADGGATDPQVQIYLERLSDAAAMSLADMTGDLVQRMRSRADALGVPSEDWFWSVLTRSLAANLPGFLKALGGDRRLPDALPGATTELARAAARRGVPLADLFQIMRAAQGPFWENWQRLFADLGVDDATRGRLADEAMRFTISYQDWITSQISAVYRAELESGGDHRLPLIAAVLSGGAVSGRALGYDLELEHVAAVASGPDRREVLAAIAESLGRYLLSVAPDPETAWGWIGGQQPLGVEGIHRVESIVPPAGTSVALGEPLRGPEGFRESHRQAVIARSVATGDPVTRYRDVALQAALVRAPEAARAFARRELDPLGDGERGERLRSTLRALFATGNGASAAAAMGVSPRTVTNRIAEIEQALGCPMHTRRTELDVALRLERLLVARDDD